MVTSIKDETHLQELLRRVACFAALDAASLKELAKNMRTASFDKGEALCTEGEPGGWMFIVDEGEVAVLKKTEQGIPIQVSTLRRGEFGGLVSMFEGKAIPRTASMIARTQVKAWVMDNDTLDRLARENGEVAMQLLRYFSGRVRRDNQNLARTLQHVYSDGTAALYEECTPEERIILDSINHKITAAESLEDIMDFLFDSIRKIGACDRLSIAFLQEDGNRVVTQYVRANYKPILLGPGFGQDLRASTLDTVLESGEPRVINDLPEHLQTHPNSRPTLMMIREGMRSSMPCPLIVEGRPVGFLFRSTREPNAYDDHQVRLHQVTAARLSQAAEKAHQIQQLKQANNAYFEMLGFVSHELKSPLGAIVMNTNLLLEEYLGPLTEKQHEKIKAIATRSRQLLELVGEYLNLAQLEGGQLKPNYKENIDFIAHVLAPALETADAHIEAKSMKLVPTWEKAPLELTCDPALLQIVMVNLLSNAAKYGKPGGEIRVRATLTPHALHVSVWNHGPGFSERDRSKLFRKFSRIPNPELMKEKGTGVGLYTTWRIIQSHQGKIKAQSEPGQWAEFILEIPRRPESRAQ